MAVNSDHQGFFERQSNENECDKAAVGLALLQLGLIRSKDAVILDAGSSAMHVAGAIFTTEDNSEAAPQAEPKATSDEAGGAETGTSTTDLSILTHNYAVFRSVVAGPFGKQGGGQHELLITGGCYDRIYNALYGKLTESSYKAFHPTVVVIAISGLLSGGGTTPGGVFCHAAIETSIKELLFRKRTGRRIVIADYTKIGRADSFLVGGLNDLPTAADGVYVVTTKPPKDDPTTEKYRDTIESLRKVRRVGVVELELNREQRLVEKVSQSVPHPNDGDPKISDFPVHWEIRARNDDALGAAVP